MILLKRYPKHSLYRELNLFKRLDYTCLSFVLCKKEGVQKHIQSWVQSLKVDHHQRRRTHHDWRHMRRVSIHVACRGQKKGRCQRVRLCVTLYVSLCTLEELYDSFNKALCQTSRTRSTTRDQLARARCKDCHSRRQEASSARVLSTVCCAMAVPSWTTRSTLPAPPPLVRNTSNTIFLKGI